MERDRTTGMNQTKKKRKSKKKRSQKVYGVKGEAGFELKRKN